jgi:NADH:quinone reductase (non-electrogenic)
MSTNNADLSHRHRVVVIGGGFGGVRAVNALENEPVDITLIDKNNQHLFQPLLYQVATGVLSSGQIAPALRSMFRKQRNVRVLLGVVDHIDLEQRTVRMIADEVKEIPYDTLIVATGATHSYFGHDEWSQIAPGMKSLDDARRVRTRILGAFEIAEQNDDPAEQAAWLTFAVVGAGPTGVELAGQIALLAHRVLKDDYRNIDPSTARVLLLDATPHVLGTYPPKLSQRAADDLRHLGVEVELSAPVTDIDLSGLTIGSGEQARRVDARTVIWAAGVKASPLAELLGKQSGAEVDRVGRVAVNLDLTLPGHPEVFAIGDMITLADVPGTAQPAIQEGKYAAKVVRARLTDKPAPPPFRYRDLGSMAVIGRTRAVADLFGKIRLGGFPAFLIWGVVHLAYLVGWGNRYEAIARWGWTILARNRREREISIVSLVSDEAALRELEEMRSVGSAQPVDQPAPETADQPS